MAEIVLLTGEHPEETISTLFAADFKTLLEGQGHTVEILPIQTTKYPGYQWSSQIAVNLIRRLEQSKKPVRWNGKTWNNSFEVLDALMKDFPALQSDKILHEIYQMEQFKGKHVFSMHSTKSEEPRVKLAKVVNKPEAVGRIEVFAPYKEYPQTVKRKMEIVLKTFQEWNAKRDPASAGNREFLLRHLERAMHYSDTSPSSIAMIQKPRLLEEMTRQVSTFVEQSERRIMQRKKTMEDWERKRKPRSPTRRV